MLRKLRSLRKAPRHLRRPQALALQTVAPRVPLPLPLPAPLPVLALLQEQALLVQALPRRTHRALKMLSRRLRSLKLPKKFRARASSTARDVLNLKKLRPIPPRLLSPLLSPNLRRR